MNEKIKQLAKEAGIWFEDNKEIRTHSISTTTLERFAELVVKECTQQCQQEWYDENNRDTKDLNARDIGMHVGLKSGMLRCLNRIKQQFGIEK